MIKTQVFDNTKLKIPQAGGDPSVWRRREVEERRGVEHRREVKQRREEERSREFELKKEVEQKRRGIEYDGGREVAGDTIHVTELPAGTCDRRLGEFFAQFGRVARAAVIYKSQVGGPASLRGKELMQFPRRACSASGS